MHDRHPTTTSAERVRRQARVLVAGALLALAAAGCVESGTVECSWGTVCPAGSACHEPSLRCVSEDLLQACEGLEEDAACTYLGAAGPGTCAEGLCVVCGNGVTEVGEVCDGSDLGDHACDDFGTTGGTLACRSDCADFSLDRCFLCGDGLCEPARSETASRCPEDCAIVALAAGSLSCALRADGHLFCWGANGYGQLGVGSTEPVVTPTLLLGMAVRSVSTHEWHTCAATADGGGWCWGNDRVGQLGDGPTSPALCDGAPCSDVPVTVTLPGDARDLAAGYDHSCAVTLDGSVLCWGDGDDGKLGDGAVTHELCDGGIDCAPTPLSVAGLTGAVAVAAGQHHTCALRQDGGVWCWGAHGVGQLGVGDATTETCDLQACSHVPLPVTSLSDVVQISAGQYHSCAVRSDGTAWCWGRNTDGQLGYGEGGARFEPEQVAGLTDVVQVTCGNSHSCALTGDGQVWCWGWNVTGALGNGDDTSSPVPVAVVGMDDAVTVAAGEGHSCAARADGTVWCWGYNDDFQLGDGTRSDSTEPVPAAPLDE